jgi:TRAP-type C4-dicarboxylate transport system substrate-binding protein
VVMNEAKWNALSKANQDAIMSMSGEVLAREAGRIWDDQDRIANEEFAKGGMKILNADERFMAELRRRLEPLEQTWIKQAAARGVDGRAAIDALRREAAAYRKPN